MVVAWNCNHLWIGGLNKVTGGVRQAGGWSKHPVMMTIDEASSQENWLDEHPDIQLLYTLNY